MLDALQRAAILENDKFVGKLIICKFWADEPTDQRTDITIEL